VGKEPAPLDTTAELLGRARNGDASAEHLLLTRFLPLLQRWARGRLPGSARDLAETDDLVQVSLLRAVRRLDAFEPRREGAFLSYLRKIVLNAIREECRRSASRANMEDRFEAFVVPGLPAASSSNAVLESYEAALETLAERQREAVILRLEFDYSYAQIAEAIESPSEDSARMMVKRALLRLAGEMRSSPQDN
jgi:RNA polymerase sigma-70 factor (ECF subfamily)